MPQKITRALLSVYDKEGVAELAAFLAARGVGIISTGGTAKWLVSRGVPVTDVSSVTDFPEILGGRVKTLHPAVHGGILASRDSAEHASQLAAHGISPINLVAVNLYPFEEAAARDDATPEEAIEQIDIGGPAMIRAAAKNHGSVAVLTSPDDYARAMEDISAHGEVTAALRLELAAKAFARTATYDAAIANWFAFGRRGERQWRRSGERKMPPRYAVAMRLAQPLRYGENPHQTGALYRADEAAQERGVAAARQIQGKELSYNNIADTDAAWDLAAEFAEPAAVIVKHANPCGAAVAETLAGAYEKALACDPVSAYGGTVAFNKSLDAATAEQLAKLFLEVIIAPDAGEQALSILGRKKNLRLLLTGGMPEARQRRLVFRSVSGGVLMQERDAGTLDNSSLKTVSARAPSAQEMADLRFAFTVCKHVKSNAIVLARDGASIGIGAGQTSRVDAVRIAVWRAKETAASVPDARGAVMASDAFLPFADGLETAAEAGITAVIHPGGSIRDDEVIAAADKHNMAVVTTGIRHFRH